MPSGVGGPAVILTGGIGSGKSLVGRILRDWGAHVVDADVLARDVVAPGTAGLAQVIAAFGGEVLASDGSLDRAALAQRVFAEPGQLAQLEAIIHPLVHQAAVAKLSALSPLDLRVYEVPLPGLSPFDEEPVVVVVDAPEEVRRARLGTRGLDEAQIEARMASQPGRAEWLGLAAYVVDNSGSRQGLLAQVAMLWSELTGEMPPVGTGG